MEKLHDWLLNVKEGKEIILEQIGLYCWKVDTYLVYLDQKFLIDSFRKRKVKSKSR